MHPTYPFCFLKKEKKKSGNLYKTFLQAIVLGTTALSNITLIRVIKIVEASVQADFIFVDRDWTSLHSIGRIKTLPCKVVTYYDPHSSDRGLRLREREGGGACLRTPGIFLNSLSGPTST